MEAVKAKNKKSVPQKQNWAIDPETGKKISKTWLAAKKIAITGAGEILDMRAVLK